MDVLPNISCISCSLQIQQFYNFYLSSLRTYEQLRNKLPWMSKDVMSKDKACPPMVCIKIEPAYSIQSEDSSTCNLATGTKRRSKAITPQIQRKTAMDKNRTKSHHITDSLINGIYLDQCGNLSTDVAKLKRPYDGSTRALLEFWEAKDRDNVLDDDQPDPKDSKSSVKRSQLKISPSSSEIPSNAKPDNTSKSSVRIKKNVTVKLVDLKLMSKRRSSTNKTDRKQLESLKENYMRSKRNYFLRRLYYKSSYDIPKLMKSRNSCLRSGKNLRSPDKLSRTIKKTRHRSSVDVCRKDKSVNLPTLSTPLCPLTSFKSFCQKCEKVFITRELLRLHPCYTN